MSNMKSITKYILLSFILWMGVACQKDEMCYTTVVETDEVTSFSDGTATCGGVITSDGRPTITERGLEWSMNDQFDNATSVKDEKQEMGKFIAVMTQLLPRTDYYVRAYAKNNCGMVYGQIQHFRTPAVDAENGHVWIDLGLSVKWATMNVGAATSDGYGNYYAWGETTPKSGYSSSTYKYCKGGAEYTMTKYCTDSRDGTVDNKTTLEAEDDAAHVNWGGKWRMPTDAEWIELREQCTWEWTTQNGTKGYLVTAKNGKSIFLPASGYRSGTNLYGVGSYGYFWSSSLYERYSLDAYGVSFRSSSVYRNNYNRSYGRSVRPVCP